MDYIESLPLNPEPEAFGLHANANIICAENETKEVFQTIMSLQSSSGTSGGDGGMSREEVLDSMCEKISTTIAQPFDVESIRMMYPLAYNESMNTVLVQECGRYNNVIRIIHATLPVLRDALKGLKVMTVELENMANAIFAMVSVWVGPEVELLSLRVQSAGIGNAIIYFFFWRTAVFF